MENVPFVITNEIAIELKKAISSALPNKEDFSIYVKSFLTDVLICDKYEQFLDILNRAGIKEVEEIIDRIAGFKEVVIDNSPELVQGIINLIQNKTTQLEAKGATFEEIQKAIMETMTFENIAPLVSKTSNDLYDKYQNGFILFDNNVELSEEEEILTNYFGLLIAKLFLQYMINHSKISEEDFAVFMKDFLLNYFEGMDALYDEVVPKKLITYIKKIKIPNEEKLRVKIVGTTHTIIETVNTIPTKNISAIDERIKFETLFESSQHYYFIMNLLVEKGFCQAETYLWKDEKNGTKGFLIAILKCLHIQGYYKDNKRLTNDQIEKIAKNTFGLQISEDTIKKKKAHSFDLKFIPLASEIS